MKLGKQIYIVGSGYEGFDLTDPYDCHVYLIEDRGDLALIDIGSGMGVDKILKYISTLGFDTQCIKYVLLTHPHADHAGGTAFLLDRGIKAQIVSSYGAADLLERGDEDGIHLTLARAVGIYPKDYKLRAFKVDRRVREGDQIQLGSITFEVIESPGHCETHICFFARIGEQNVLFSGDTIFYNGKIHLINTSDCNLQQYSQTAMKLASLDVDVLLPGHQMPALQNGKRHLELAAATFSKMGIPEKII